MAFIAIGGANNVSYEITDVPDPVSFRAVVVTDRPCVDGSTSYSNKYDTQYLTGDSTETSGNFEINPGTYTLYAIYGYALSDGESYRWYNVANTIVTVGASIGDFTPYKPNIYINNIWVPATPYIYINDEWTLRDTYIYTGEPAPPSDYGIWGVQIDLTNPNHETAVTYTDDAIGMTPGAAAWDSTPLFSGIKPCMLLNGVVQYYLNPNNFAQKADGSFANITSGVAGDVMIEIPKIGFKINTVGSILTIQVTDNPNDENFKYYAHTRTVEGDRDKLYIGAYLGYTLSSRLRSLSAKAPTVSQTIGTFRTRAKANGIGYDMVSFYPLTLLQCLYLIRYKNKDCQIALGRGYVDGNNGRIITGGTNIKGMFFGETTGKEQIKCFGIEDLWGNIRWWIDGLASDTNRRILTAFEHFGNYWDSYTDRGAGTSFDMSGFMTRPQGTTEKGFILKERLTTPGEASFPDLARQTARCWPYFGGHWNQGSSAGIFALQLDIQSEGVLSSLGARLMYL